MTDLSHLDAAETFSGQEAAALAVGLDPLDPRAELWKAGPVLTRMVEGHRIARVFVNQPMTPAEFKTQRKSGGWADALVSVLFDQFPVLQKSPLPSDPNRSFELPKRFAGTDGEFQAQRFARAEIQRWLSAIGMKSVYPFDRKQSTMPKEIVETDTEKEDLPEELDAANIAFRAFTTGYGDPSKPPRSRIADFVRENYPTYTEAAIDRIATIANPDKTPGRKQGNVK